MKWVGREEGKLVEGTEGSEDEERGRKSSREKLL